MVSRKRRSIRDYGLVFILLAAWLALLCIAGGASRADVLGQSIVRVAAFGIAAALALLAPPPKIGEHRWPAYLLVAAVALVLIQLIPLPPGLWMRLPGRELFADAARVAGEMQPWRPLSIAPEETWNALWSLCVPLVTFWLATLAGRELARLVMVLLILVVISCLIALMQFSGGDFDHPLINDIGDVSGLFANRNHFALFAAIGSPLAFLWASHGPGQGGRQIPWRYVIAGGLSLVFLLTILATGSRAGMLLGAAGLVLAIATVWRSIIGEMQRLPKGFAIGGAATLVAGIAGVIAASVLAGRADSFNRAVDMNAAEDLRVRALPTVWEMVGDYFPVGTGFGTFDQAFRIAEPDALLSPAYFNLAHNDLLQPALDGGILGALLLAVAIGWWAWRSFVVWRAPHGYRTGFAKTGSVIVLMVIAASVIDYPARTPMFMAIIVIAAVWLSRSSDAKSG